MNFKLSIYINIYYILQNKRNNYERIKSLLCIKLKKK